MNELLLNRRLLGANLINGMVEFVIWAPNAVEVNILTKDGSRLGLIKEEKGYWTGKTDRFSANSLYKVELDGKELPDPTSLSQPEGVHGFSEIIDISDFNWTDQYWINYPLHKYIIYEVHCGTFSYNGDFAGIEERIFHLKELGITAIEIMPVA